MYVVDVLLNNTWKYCKL